MSIPHAWEFLPHSTRERKKEAFLCGSQLGTQNCPLLSLTNLSSPEKLQPWARRWNFAAGPVADGHWERDTHPRLSPDPGLIVVPRLPGAKASIYCVHSGAIRKLTHRIRCNSRCLAGGDDDVFSLWAMYFCIIRSLKSVGLMGQKYPWRVVWEDIVPRARKCWFWFQLCYSFAEKP